MASFFSSSFFGFGKKRSSSKKFARDLDDDTDKEKSYPRAKSTGLFKGQLFPRTKISSLSKFTSSPYAPGSIAPNVRLRCAPQGPLVAAVVPVCPPLPRGMASVCAPTQNAFSRFSIFALFWPLFFPCYFNRPPSC